MSHLIDSAMVYIHPPLSIIGYVLVFLSFVFILIERRNKRHVVSTQVCLYAAWLLNLMGLVSGMLWAQMAWGSYWSWDPKETITLLLFLCIGFSALLYERRKKVSFILLCLSLLCIIINVVITLGNFGLHSYNI